MTRQAWQEHEKLFDELGIIVLKVVRNNHFKLRLRAPDGREQTKTIANTPSCSHTRKNEAAQIRAFARGRK